MARLLSAGIRHHQLATSPSYSPPSTQPPAAGQASQVCAEHPTVWLVAMTLTLLLGLEQEHGGK